jgi:DNA mismatch endonuclease, patch repair protein
MATRGSYRPKPADEIRRNMSAIRSGGNQAEVALRKEVHRMGLRFRVYPRHVFGRPDFVFPGKRVAVFVDGDFWHGRVLIEQGMDALRERHRDRAYWVDKMIKRVQRDELVTKTLEESGWLVLRFWESEVRADVGRLAGVIRDAVVGRP